MLRRIKLKILSGERIFRSVDLAPSIGNDEVTVQKAANKVEDDKSEIELVENGIVVNFLRHVGLGYVAQHIHIGLGGVAKAIYFGRELVHINAGNVLLI